MESGLWKPNEGFAFREKGVPLLGQEGFAHNVAVPAHFPSS
jgi:hypothetical protein